VSAQRIDWTAAEPDVARAPLNIVAGGVELVSGQDGPVPAVLLRRGHYADVPALHALLDAYAQQGLLLPRTPEQIGKRIHEFTVAVDARGIVGCGALRLYTHKLAELVALGVDERAQGQGIGRIIVEAAPLRPDAAGEVLQSAGLPHPAHESDAGEAGRGLRPVPEAARMQRDPGAARAVARAR